VTEIRDHDSFLPEPDAEDRHSFAGQAARWTIAFGLLFAGVFFCFWWSGAAVRFGAARVTDRLVPTWRVFGSVRNARSGEPVAWAEIADDPDGRPPFFQTEAGYTGDFSLLTIAEPHLILVRAIGFRPQTMQVGRQWFVWWPRGEERLEVSLVPE
jgi:hypothetical protein